MSREPKTQLKVQLPPAPLTPVFFVGYPRKDNADCRDTQWVLRFALACAILLGLAD